jgi:hypothetical protein
MPKSFASVAGACLLALAADVALAAHPEPPAGIKEVLVGGESISFWPYTTSDYENPSDPINLVFPNADPRAIRQALMALNGTRPEFAALGIPAHDCTWTDAMGYEQAAFVEPAGYVAGAVQLACVVKREAPLGDPFRFHIRLFRSGRNTVGNAHYEILIPGTAEHEVLSWDLARNFATYDVARTGKLMAPPAPLADVIPPGSFRTMRRAVYEGLAPQAGALLTALGLFLPAQGDVPIPTSGAAFGFVTDLELVSECTRNQLSARVQYQIVVPKPFCAAEPAPGNPGEFVALVGPLDFSLTVETDHAGGYERSYHVGGMLTATPMRLKLPPTSPPAFEPTGEPSVEALVLETHRGELDDRRGQVTEKAAQVLLGDPKESLRWHFAAGGHDKYLRKLFCGE